MEALLQTNNRIIKLFTINKGISQSLLSLITFIDYPHYEWVDDPQLADYLTFPTNYEVGHELTDYYLHYFKGVSEDRRLVLLYEEQLMELAQKFNKRIIIFYFSDLSDAIPIEKAIVFRTSILKSNKRSNEFAMPAFKPGLPTANTLYPNYIQWGEKPSVGFRGQAAPLKLKVKISLRNCINLFYNRIGKGSVFKINTNHGYLQRRNALLYLQRSKFVKCNFIITDEQDINNENSIRLFWENIIENPYNLCISGYGNYSYRLYEVLSAGRIPIFVDTDCKLPFEEFINWKDYIVWVNSEEIPKISRTLLDFHYTKRGVDFITHQQKLKQLWDDFLSPANFFIKIKAYL